MPKFVIDQLDYGLSQVYGSQVLAGSAFAFVAPQTQPDDTLQAGLQAFYGVPGVAARRVLPLLPDGLTFPGFKITPFQRPFDLTPVLLPDKEIYRAGKDNVCLLVVTPAWLYSRPDRSRPETANLTIENNGVVLRSQPVKLDGGLTLVDLGALPQGHYRVFWPHTNENDDTRPAECEFSSVEYVLAPLQATLQGYEFSGNQLTCRLKIDRFNEPLTEAVQLDLWSGGNRLDGNKVKAGLPGVYQTRFKVKTKSQARLEVRVTYQDLVATAVIPNSTKAERQDVIFNPLGSEVRLSLQPGPASREVRGLYLSSDGPVNNSPVTLADPAPQSRVAKLSWLAEAGAARLLILDLAGKVVEDRDLGSIPANTELEINIPAPGGFLALGAWLGDKAWEGWSSLVVPSTGKITLETPATARPGHTVKLKIDTKSPSSVYVLVRDSRLAGATPQDRLAATLKGGFESAAKWATIGYISKKVNELDEWPDLMPRYRTMAFGGAVPSPVRMAMPVYAPPPAPFMEMSPVMNMASSMVEKARPGALYKGGIMPQMDFDAATTGPAQAEATVRQDFADVAYCAVIQTGADGRAAAEFKLPEAITAYRVEAFAFSQEGREWAYTSESLEVSQPLWAEFKLPAFVYPNDLAPAVLEVNCNSGKFSLKLLCDGQPVAYKLSGAQRINADSFQGQRAKVTFDARPGKWRAELQDLSSGEFDISERTVEALGKFTSLARRFQMLLAGQSLDRATAGALQLRVLPSLDTPFKVLCDATTDYGHRCCQQTAAKLLAGVAALVAAGKENRAKYRDVILAGVARERSMFLPGRGFMMYPPEESGGNREPNDYWGKLAARHLGDLSYLGASSFQDLDGDLSEALKELQVMGEDALKAYRMPLVPEKIESGRDAFQVVLKKGKKQNEALSYARNSLQNQAAAAGKGQVLAREEKAYAAATLLAGGIQADLLTAIKAANDLTKDLDGEGRLYSTVDSAALICLLLGLKSAGIGAGGDARLKLDGREMSLAEALEAGATSEVHLVEVVQGAALVEVTSEVIEDWNSFRDTIPVSVELVRRNRKGQSVRLGDTLDLVVKLREYIPGHLLHVCLPPSLSSLEGGGEVKKFSLDFTGRTELRLPLRATGFTVGKGEHWAVLVRNMFNEEQAGTPGLLVAQVSAD